MDLKLATLTLCLFASATGQNLRTQQRYLPGGDHWDLLCAVPSNCDGEVDVSDLEKAAEKAVSSWDSYSSSSSSEEETPPGPSRRNLKGQERRTLGGRNRRDLKSRSATVSLNGCSSKDMASSIQSAMSSVSSDSSTSSADASMDCVSETLVKNLCGDSEDVMAFAERAFGDRRLKNDVDVRYIPYDANVRSVDCSNDDDVSAAIRDWENGR